MEFLVKPAIAAGLIYRLMRSNRLDLGAFARIEASGFTIALVIARMVSVHIGQRGSARRRRGLWPNKTFKFPRRGGTGAISSMAVPN
jgi:hypothetical protein